VRLNNWAYGANFGILFEPSEMARFGINYRSQISYSLSGPAKVSGIPGIKSGNVESSVTVPDTVTASAVVNVLPELQLLGNLTWTHWDVFDQLEATFDNGLPNLVIWEDFRDTWNAALGANYDITKEWAVRMGFAFDQSPVTDNNRTVRLPDANRWFLSAGVGFHLTDDIVFDLGYMHVFIEDGTVNETDEQPGNANIRGNYTGGRADLFAFQGTYNFDHLFEFYDSLKQRFTGS
jgi:long-chain fatty acid transport protein